MYDAFPVNLEEGSTLVVSKERIEQLKRDLPKLARFMVPDDGKFKHPNTWVYIPPPTKRKY